MTAPPLLACNEARIDVGGVPLIEGLTCKTAGRRIALVGDWTALFALLGSEARLGRGSVEIGGRPATQAVSSGAAGLARFGLPLPARWNVLELMQWSALLLGLRRSFARQAGGAALETLGLGGLARRALGSLNAVERRAVLIAHACLGAPTVLILEAPLQGVDDAAQTALRDLIERARADRDLLFSVDPALPTPAERALVQASDQVLLLERGSLVAQGAPDRVLEPARRYLVGVTRHAGELGAALAERAFVVTPSGGSPHQTGEAARFLIELPPGGTPDTVLGLSLELDAPVVELEPVQQEPSR